MAGLPPSPLGIIIISVKQALIVQNPGFDEEFAFFGTITF
jgi:hypothetical protein